MQNIAEGDEVGASRVVRVIYTNYRSETAERRILPERLWFGSTPWHPEPQWLIDAIDLEKGQRRSFAVADISSWVTTP